MSKRTAIVAMCVGNKYVEMFEKHCRANWQPYADRIGSEIVLIDRVLDTSERASSRPMVWQKLIIPELPEMQAYDQIVLIDTDILINTARAPSIFDAVDVERIGAVESYSNPNKKIYSEILGRMYANWDRIGQPYVDNRTGSDLYRRYGFDNPPDDVVQTGVIVLSPSRHAGIFRHAYDTYDDKGGGAMNHEARPLSYEIVTSGLAQWIDYRFNFVVSDQIFLNYGFMMDDKWLEELRPTYGDNVVNYVLYRTSQRCLKQMFENSYFLHFAGQHWYMPMALQAISE